MHARVAGAAEGDQSGGGVSGPAVVDDERRRGVTDAAGVVVAGQDPFPAPAEAGPLAPAAVVAGFAQPAAVELGVAAGAAQRELGLRDGGHGAGLGSGFFRSLRRGHDDGESAARLFPNPQGTPRSADQIRQAHGCRDQRHEKRYEAEPVPCGKGRRLDDLRRKDSVGIKVTISQLDDAGPSSCIPESKGQG